MITIQDLYNIGNNYITIMYHEASPYIVVANATPDNDFLKLLLWNQNGELIDEVKTLVGGTGVWLYVAGACPSPARCRNRS